MAQFDVFGNLAATRREVPFLVSVQCSRYDRMSTVLVAPLALPSRRLVEMPWLAPTFVIAGREVVLNVFGLATLPISRLGRPLKSLADEDSRGKMIRALDELISQA